MICLLCKIHEKSVAYSASPNEIQIKHLVNIHLSLFGLGQGPTGAID